MSLSARYSDSPYFADSNSRDHGKSFMSKANTLYDSITNSSTPHPSSLRWLQGCILLAYCRQATCPNWSGDALTTVCRKLACDLELHKTDERATQHENSRMRSSTDDDWVSKEERRRAWWSVWELERFDCIASRQLITRSNLESFVKLPISDEAWFGGKPVASECLDADPHLAWKSLKGSENGDPRAWFLVGNDVMSRCYQLGLRDEATDKEIDDMEMVISCFLLLFHDRFQTSGRQLPFDERNHPQSNWKLLTQIMLQTYVFMSRFPPFDNVPTLYCCVLRASR